MEKRLDGGKENDSIGFLLLGDKDSKDGAVAWHWHR